MAIWITGIDMAVWQPEVDWVKTFTQDTLSTNGPQVFSSRERIEEGL